MNTLRHFIRSPISALGVDLSSRTEAHRGLLERYSMLNRGKTRIIPISQRALHNVGHSFLNPLSQSAK